MVKACGRSFMRRRDPLEVKDSVFLQELGVLFAALLAEVLVAIVTSR
jgi:hypothetical protein